MKKIPETINGVPTLGYLVTYRIKEGSVPVADYSDFLDTLYNSPDYEKSDIEALRVKTRHPRHIYAAAVRKVRKLHDNQNNNVRFFFRSAKAGSDRTEKVLIRESFPHSKNKPLHEIVGNVRLDPTTGAPHTINNGLHSDETAAILEQVVAEFAKEVDNFPCNGLRHRFGKVVADCLPIAYDAEHLFKFVFRENSSAIRLLDTVIGYLNEQCGVATGPRSSRSEVSILPLPDLAEIREAISTAYTDEMEDTQASVAAAIAAYTADPEPDKLMGTINKIKQGLATMKKYDFELKVQTGGVRLAMLDMQKKARVLLGRDEPEATSHCFNWKTARTRLPMPQWVIGDALNKQEYSFTVARSHLEYLSFRKGLGDSAVAHLVQTDLEDWENIHLSLSSVETIPPELAKVGFVSDLSGLGYDGPATDELVAAVSSWWAKL